MEKHILILALSAAFLIFLISYIKNRRVAAGLFMTAAQGLLALFAVDLIGSLFDVHINLNPFSAAVSALGGTPGVIFLLIMDIIG